MKRVIRYGALLLSTIMIASAICASTGPRAEARHVRMVLMASGVPTDVTSFLKRKGACERLSEDDGDDPGRLTETVRLRVQMRCNLLRDEENRLRARYAKQPDVMEMIDRGDD